MNVVGLWLTFLEFMGIFELFDHILAADFESKCLAFSVVNAYIYIYVYIICIICVYKWWDNFMQVHAFEV